MMKVRIRRYDMRKEVTVGQGRLACVCPMSAIRSQMGLRDGMEGGRAGRNDWHFVLGCCPVQFNQPVSQSVSPPVSPSCASASGQNRCQCRCQDQCWIIQTHCRFSSTVVQLSMVDPKPGGRATDPPLKTSPPQDQASRRVGLSPVGSPIDRPAASALSCCRVVGGVAGGTHNPRKDPRNPRSQDPVPSSSIHISLSRTVARAAACSVFLPPRLPVQTPARLHPASETSARGLRGRCGLLSTLLLVSESWAEWIAVTA